MPVSILAISAGASAGALLRWQLNLLLNSLLPNLPLGTLCANWLGGWLMGLALGLFALFPNLGGEWRLMLVTGFLGALTTFSAFSAEMTALIQAGRLWLCTLGIALHVGGSIIWFFWDSGALKLQGAFWPSLSPGPEREAGSWTESCPEARQHPGAKRH